MDDIDETEPVFSFLSAAKRRARINPAPFMIIANKEGSAGAQMLYLPQSSRYLATRKRQIRIRRSLIRQREALYEEMHDLENE